LYDLCRKHKKHLKKYNNHGSIGICMKKYFLLYKPFVNWKLKKNHALVVLNEGMIFKNGEVETLPSISNQSYCLYFVTSKESLKYGD